MLMRGADMQKKRVHGKNIAILGGILLLTLLGLYLANRIEGKPSLSVGKGGKQLMLEEELMPESMSGSMVFCVDGLLLEVQGRNLKAKPVKGGSPWNIMMPSVISRVVGYGSHIGVFDEGGNLCCYNLQGKQVWRTALSNEVIDTYGDENGYILVEYKGLKGSLAEVFNPNGSKVGGIALENAHILGFAANSSAFSIIVLDLSSETLKTKILTHDSKGDVLWANNYNDEILSSIQYHKNGSLTVVSETKLYKYKSDGKLMQEMVLSGKPIHTAMSEQLIVTVTQKQGNTVISCFDETLKQKCQFNTESMPQGIHAGKNSFLVYTKDSLQHISDKGSLISSYKANMDISRAYMTANDQIYISSNKKLQLLQYR